MANSSQKPQLTEKERRLLRKGPVELNRLLYIAGIVFALTMLYGVVSGMELVRERKRLVTDTEAGVVAGRKFFREAPDSHTSRVWKQFEEARQKFHERVRQLQNTLGANAVGEPVREVLVLSEKIEDRLVVMVLQLVGWHQEITMRGLRLALVVMLGLFIALSALLSYFTALPFSKISEKLSEQTVTSDRS